MNQSRIQLLIPDMPDRAALAPFLAAMDEARWYTNFGPLLRRFEQEVRAVFPSPAPTMLTSVTNGTLALELTLAALGLPKGARVLVPAFTFVATASAVVRAGCQPVISDIDPGTWVMTPAIAHAAMKTGRIDCVLPVAALGNPLPAAEWDAFSSQTGIPVLVDAAGAIGNQAAGERITLAFSLHATKALGIGEGGLLVSRDAAFLERVRRLSNFGIDPSTGFAADVGSNAKVSEFHAAVGLAALRRWPERRKLRQTLHGTYCDALLRRCPGVTLQARPRDGVYTIMQVVLPEGMRREPVMAALAEKNIETRAWYLPLIPDHPGYANAASCALPVARSLAPRMVGLPFHLDLTTEHINRICTALAGVLGVQG